jgi:tRNA/rRNA methyltransferase
LIPTRFILIETSHAGNVGATARAMKVMGFDDLVLVRPRWDNVLRREETIQRASGAIDVLRGARLVDNLEQACVGMSHLCATAMTPRDFGPPTLTPREHLSAFKLQLEQAQSAKLDGVDSPTHRHSGIAFLFGSERFGMTNEDVYKCHVALTIDTNPAFGSLNLAAAVQLIAYEWRLCLGGFTPQGAGLEGMKGAQDGHNVQVNSVHQPNSVADAAQIAGLLAHLQSALEAIGFLDPLAPKKLMPRLNQLFNRSELSTQEVDIFRGIAKAILAASEQRVVARAKSAPSPR